MSRYGLSKDVAIITAKRQKKKKTTVCQYQNISNAYIKALTYIYFRDYKLKPIGLLI